MLAVSCAGVHVRTRVYRLFIFFVEGAVPFKIYFFPLLLAAIKSTCLFSFLFLTNRPRYCHYFTVSFFFFTPKHTALGEGYLAVPEWPYLTEKKAKDAGTGRRACGKGKVYRRLISFCHM
uniref:Uncharacterized protein n=1 Tax=Trypanosoma congolense (strain IL3000) TaxID=1068625 RepID=G0UQR6_TRYCI|nr:hypothetical protein, unlikely [Trypanosoma congolense IL3000]